MYVSKLRPYRVFLMDTNFHFPSRFWTLLKVKKKPSYLLRSVSSFHEMFGTLDTKVYMPLPHIHTYSW